jgi:hypothetical protein
MGAVWEEMGVEMGVEIEGVINGLGVQEEVMLVVQQGINQWEVVLK